MTKTFAAFAALAVLSFAAGVALADAGPEVADAAVNASASVELPAEVPASTGDQLGAAIDYFRAGKLMLGFAVVLMLIGASLRKIVGLVARDFAASKLGGKVIGGLSAFAVTFGAGYVASGFSLDLIMASIVGAGAAAGLWSMAPDKAKAKLRPGG